MVEARTTIQDNLYGVTFAAPSATAAKEARVETQHAAARVRGAHGAGRRVDESLIEVEEERLLEVEGGLVRARGGEDAGCQCAVRDSRDRRVEEGGGHGVGEEAAARLEDGGGCCNACELGK
jgi:hypothetical protein